MIYLEAFQLAILAVLLVDSSLSDLKTGRIPNRDIVIALFVGLVSSLIYYALFAKDCFLPYTINIIIISCISVLLYSMGIWGAGDCKLLITTMMVFPARLYCIQDRSVATGFLLVIIIFLLAFVYFVFESVFLDIKSKTLAKLQFSNFKVLEICKGFIYYFLFLNIVNSIMFSVIPEKYLFDVILVAAIQFVSMLLSTKFENRATPPIIFAMIIIWGVLLSLNIAHFNIRNISIRSILLIIPLMVFRSVSEKYNYETIPVSSLKPGMILSYTTIILFTGSKVVGLPKTTSEDLRSRINAEEVASIVRWSKAKKGRETVTIVRKVPFALFIAAGTLIFTLIEVLLV